ncbi:MAG TPA: acetylxylan esterase [Planctomycetota bacterium]|jgi:dienelactone hydrolase
MRRGIGISCALFVALQCAFAEDAFTKMKLEDAWLKTPRTFPAPDLEKPGVKAVYYEGAPLNGKPTRVFAYYGVPAGTEAGATPAGKKVPGIVLIHGGGGTAFETWVQLWNKRGYAAISMDTCGCIPRGKTPNSKFSNQWERIPDGGPPGWGGFDQMDKPGPEHWTYHAASAAIIANSLLRSLPEVDAERIGVTGISWGGYLTCIVAGLDTRLKFAVPVYGCGFLGDNSTWAPAIKGMGAKGERWLKLWDPSVYLQDATAPILWVTGTNDFAYPMDSLQKSYRCTKGERTLCLKIRMPHGHGGAGENPPEILAFADSLLRDGKPLAKITKAAKTGFDYVVNVSGDAKITHAELCFTKDVGEWQKRKWESVPAKLTEDGKRAIATIPSDAKVYYMNLSDERGLVVSTEHVEIQN